MTQTDQEPELAGTNCPNCQTVCIYQPPMDAIMQGIQSVSIACHHCDHVFETALPQSALAAVNHLMPPQEMASDAAMFAEDLDDSRRAKQRRKRKDKKPKMPKTPRAPMGLGKRIGVIVLLGLGVSAAVIGAGILLTPPVDTRSIEDQFKVKNKTDRVEAEVTPAPEPAPEPAPAPVPDVGEETAPTAPAPEPTPAPEPVPEPNIPAEAKFIASNTGFTVTEGDLGMVMTINAIITNEGGKAGIPNDIVIYLLDANGNELMSWPMIIGKRPIEPAAQRSLATQIIEPPEGVALIEIDIQ